MARENAQDKGKRLLAEGRLIVTKVTGHAHERVAISAICRGDSAEVYSLGYDVEQEEWRCTCEARGKCSHLWALQLVTRKP